MATRRPRSPARVAPMSRLRRTDIASSTARSDAHRAPGPPWACDRVPPASFRLRVDAPPAETRAPPLSARRSSQPCTLPSYRTCVLVQGTAFGVRRCGGCSPAFRACTTIADCGAEVGIRTRTGLPPAVFKTAASAGSATSARGPLRARRIVRRRLTGCRFCPPARVPVLRRTCALSGSVAYRASRCYRRRRANLLSPTAVTGACPGRSDPRRCVELQPSGPGRHRVRIRWQDPAYDHNPRYLTGSGTREKRRNAWTRRSSRGGGPETARAETQEPPREGRSCVLAGRWRRPLEFDR